MVVSMAEAQIQKNAGNFGKLATAHDINILSVANGCQSMTTPGNRKRTL